MIKLCAMHVCNLGVVITANGGALYLGCNICLWNELPNLQVADSMSNPAHMN